MQVKVTVTEYLERARECAALADKMTGDDKAKMLEIAEAWLRLADEAAKTALKIESELPRK
jgi:hypothetical protein